MVNAITEIALATTERIRPHCVSIEIAGPMRRGAVVEGAFEIVCAPRIDKLDGKDVIPLRDELRAMFNSGWAFDAVRPANTSAHKRLIHVASRIVLDLFTVPEGAWPGWLMFRTGPETFYRAFGARLTRTQWSMSDGIIHTHPPNKRNGVYVVCPYGAKCDHANPVKTEERLFGLIEWPYLKPEERGAWAAKRDYERP